MTTQSTSQLVLDSYALLAFFRAEPAAQMVKEILTRADRGEVRLAMTTVNLGEVVYRTIRERGNEQADAVLARVLEYSIDIVDIDQGLALTAARFKGQHRISYADCLAAALAQRLDAPLITGDPDFKHLEDVITVEWLASGAQ